MKLSKEQIGMVFEIGDGNLHRLAGHIEGASWPWVFKSGAKYNTYYNDDGVIRHNPQIPPSDFDRE